MSPVICQSTRVDDQSRFYAESVLPGHAHSITITGRRIPSDGAENTRSLDKAITWPRSFGRPPYVRVWSEQFRGAEWFFSSLVLAPIHASNTQNLKEPRLSSSIAFKPSAGLWERGYHVAFPFRLLQDRAVRNGCNLHRKRWHVVTPP